MRCSSAQELVSQVEPRSLLHSSLSTKRNDFPLMVISCRSQRLHIHSNELTLTRSTLHNNDNTLRWANSRDYKEAVCGRTKRSKTPIKMYGAQLVKTTTTTINNDNNTNQTNKQPNQKYSKQILQL